MRAAFVSGVVIAALLAALPARAHVGAVIAKAEFIRPAPPVSKVADGGLVWTYAPEEADQSYTLQWNDGDVDPTAKFTFYYLDHAVSDAVSAAQVEMIGTPVRDVNGRTAEVFAGCTCQNDPEAGIVCAPIPDGGTRWCDNQVVWDTSQLPDGTYWIAAVNRDPPYHVYNPTRAPVRIAHGPKKPPVVIVLRPDGIGSADQSYVVSLLASGTGAVTVDLAYGTNELEKVLGPTTGLAKALPATPSGDGTVRYTWDTSKIPNGTYFVRATIKDDTGISTYSDSRYGVAVYHLNNMPDLGAAPDAAAPDLSTPTVTKPGSGCSVAPNGGVSSLGALLSLAALSLFLRRRSQE